MTRYRIPQLGAPNDFEEHPQTIREIRGGGAPVRIPDGIADLDGLVTRSASLDATPITELEYDPTSAGVYVLEVFEDGALWGREGDHFHWSTDGGVTWTQGDPLPPDTIRGLILAGDGEVLAHSGQAVYKSSGWGTGAASWRQVFENPQGGTSNIRRWGFDGYGAKFIVTAYAADDRIHSRWVWISTDYGKTWNVVYDQEERGNNDVSHLHGVCYDRWEDRFWLSDGHGDDRGLFYSDDNGATWTKLGGDLQPNPMPTTITATERGIVAAGDSSIPNGIFVIRRQPDPALMHFDLAYQWRQHSGFGDTAKRDPRTGLVYIGWRTGDRPRISPAWNWSTESASRPPWIGVSDGNTATIVYEWPEDNWSRGDRFRDVIPDSRNGVVLGRLELNSNIGSFRGRLNPVGSQPPTLPDGSAGVFGGVATDPRSIAIGGGTRVPAAVRTIAIGPAALAEGGSGSGDSVLVGFGAYAAPGGRIVAIGSRTRAEPESVVIGRAAVGAVRDVVVIGDVAQATEDARFAVVVGKEAEASGLYATVIGYQAKAGSSTVAIGRAVEASEASRSVLVGSGASTVDTDVVVLGYDASSGGRYAVAVGPEASAAALQAVAVGRLAEAAQSAVALGGQARANYNDAVVIGSFARVGDPEDTEVDGRQTVAIGREAYARHRYSIAIGYDAVADGSLFAIAIGSESRASHGGSIALGRGTVTDASNQIATGRRHYRMQPVTSTPSAPEDGVKFWVEEIEGQPGKHRLAARFPTGVIQVIAEEP